MIDAIVIGGGLFGQVAAKTLERTGREVLVLDDAREGRASPCAACLMKPSWLTAFEKPERLASLRLLDELYGVQELALRLPGGLTAKVDWVRPSDVLNDKAVTVMRERVSSFTRKSGFWLVDTSTGTIATKILILATGVWGNELLYSVSELSGRTGAAFLAPGKTFEEGFIRPYAPYKQIVGFNRGDGAWVGDGQSIKTENWTSEREEKSFARVLPYFCEAVGDIERLPIRTLVGHRPIAKGVKTAVLREAHDDLWIVNGGGKSGMLAAGWCGVHLGKHYA